MKIPKTADEYFECLLELTKSLNAGDVGGSGSVKQHPDMAKAQLDSLIGLTFAKDCEDSKVLVRALGLGGEGTE